MTDWRAWHEGYDDPSSSLSQRLVAVQEQIRALRIVVEQENDSLSLDRRRQLRARERSKPVPVS